MFEAAVRSLIQSGALLESKVSLTLLSPAGGGDGRRTGRTRKVGQRMAVVSEAERSQAATARLAALEDDDFAAVADAGADNSDDEFVVGLGGSDDGARPACARLPAACVAIPYSCCTEAQVLSFVQPCLLCLLEPHLSWAAPRLCVRLLWATNS